MATVSDILSHKGSDVVAVPADESATAHWSSNG